MNKKIVWLIAALLAILVAGVAMLGFIYVKPADETGNQLRVAAILIQPEVPFWEDVWKGVRDASAKESIALSEYPYGKQDEETALLVESAVLSKVDGIILRTQSNPNEAFANALKLAREQGIFVVTIDFDTDEQLRDHYIGIDNTRAVQEIAESLLPHTDAEQSVLIVNTKNMPPTGLERISAFEDVINLCAPGTPIKTLLLPSGEAQRQQVLGDFLTANPDVGIVFCGAAIVTLTAAYTVQRLDLWDSVRVVGFGESEEAETLLRHQCIYALVSQQPYQMGTSAVQCLSALASGEHWTQDMRNMPYTVLKRTDETSAQRR